MHFGRIAFGALLASLTHAVAQGAPVNEKSHILDQRNFDDKTSTGTWIIKHFSPSCIHCQHFQPKWDSVVSQRAIPLSALNVHFGEIDCMDNVKLCEQNNATSWPTVAVFRASKRLGVLEGDKSEKEFSDFVERTIGEATGGSAAAAAYDANSVVLGLSNFTDTTKKGVWVVKHYSPVCPHCQLMAPDWVKMTDELAKRMADSQILFGEVSCPDNKKICQDNHVDGYPTVNLYVDGRYIEEMLVKYTYDAMKGYVLKLPERIKRGEFAQPVEPVVANDNRDWDDADEVPKSNKVAVAATAQASHAAPAAPTADALASNNNVIDAPHSSEPHNPYGEVITLTKENFADKTSSGPWFIKFYAPWCSHCQHLAPIWAQLGEASKGKVNIGQVNCDDASALCAKYNVQGYPTLKLLWENETTDFKGTRDLDSLVGFLDRTLAQPNVVRSADEIKQAQKVSDVIYVFAYDTSDTSAKTKAALTHVKANAQKMFLSRQLNIIPDAGVARQTLSALSDLTLPALVALKDGKTVKFEGALTNDDQLHEWFYAERFPLLPELSRDNSDALFYDTDYLVLAVLDTERGEDYTSNYRNIVREAAIEYNQVYSSAGTTPKRTVRFAWVDGNKWAAYVDRVFRIRRANWPAVVIAQPSEDQFYTTDVSGSPIAPTKSGIFSAIRAVLEGKLKPQSTNSIIV
ncbi:hypothetical protein GGI04_003008, partial [Coemansia thaxteri]